MAAFATTAPIHRAQTAPQHLRGCGYDFLDPIAPGMKRPAFMALLQERIETATNRLLAHDGAE